MTRTRNASCHDGGVSTIVYRPSRRLYCQSPPPRARDKQADTRCGRERSSRKSGSRGGTGGVPTVRETPSVHGYYDRMPHAWKFIFGSELYRARRTRISGSHQPSHKSLCIRARLQTCRNGSNNLLGFSPEGSCFLQRLALIFSALRFARRESRAPIQRRTIHEMSSPRAYSTLDCWAFLFRPTKRYCSFGGLAHATCGLQASSHPSNSVKARSQTMAWRCFLSRMRRRVASSSGISRSKVMLAG